MNSNRIAQALNFRSDASPWRQNYSIPRLGMQNQFSPPNYMHSGNLFSQPISNSPTPLPSAPAVPPAAMPLPPMAAAPGLSSIQPVGQPVMASNPTPAPQNQNIGGSAFAAPAAMPAPPSNYAGAVQPAFAPPAIPNNGPMNQADLMSMWQKMNSAPAAPSNTGQRAGGSLNGY